MKPTKMIHVYVYISEGVITYKNTWNFSHQTVKYGTFGEREENWGERNGKVDISHFTLCAFGDTTD